MRTRHFGYGMCLTVTLTGLTFGCGSDGGSSSDGESGSPAAGGAAAGGADAAGGRPGGGAAGAPSGGGSPGSGGAAESSGGTSGGSPGTGGMVEGAGGATAGSPGAGGVVDGSGGATAGAPGAGGAVGGGGGAAGAPTGSGGATIGSGGASGGAAGAAPSCPHDGSAADVVLSDGDDLQAAVDAAESGGVIWLGPGTYSCLQVEQRVFTSDAPLIIRNDPTRSGEVRIVPGSCWFAVRIVGSSYVVLDGVHVDGGGISVYVDSSDHVIVSDLDVDNSGQEGIQVRNDSTYVDVLRNTIHDVGVTEPQWGECIYVGTGGDDDFPDHTEYVWIEGNEVYRCGAAEGINIKPEVFFTTVRGNVIHDITPGTPDQYNQSALTVEGESRDYLLTTPREIWVENNQIHAVTLGEWGHCAMVGGTGVYFVNNVIRDCDEYGIYGNGFGNLDFPLVLYGNDVASTGSDPVWVDGAITLDETDPGPNPLRPQDWYCD